MCRGFARVLLRTASASGRGPAGQLPRTTPVIPREEGGRGRTARPLEDDAAPALASRGGWLAVALYLRASGDHRHKSRDADLCPLLQHEVEAVRADKRLVEDQ